MSIARRLLLLCLLAPLAGCTSRGSSQREVEAPPVPQTAPEPVPQTAPEPVPQPTFDAERAFAILERQVEFGPRDPGSEGHDACLDYLVDEMGKYADSVVEQDFTLSTLFGGPYDFTNVIGFFGPEGGDKLMLCAHWDTRPVADHDPDPANRKTPILGANDGASGVAVLLEIARAFGEKPPPVPVILALWDAEDSGDSNRGRAPYYGFLLGSEYYTQNWPKGGRPDEVILLDIVGGDNEHNDRVGTRRGGDDTFDLPIEGYSLLAAPALIDEIYSTAERLGHKAFTRSPGDSVIDDHKPFIAAGIPSVDLIDFDFPEWHTVDDTPEHCSADSLGQVGDTLLTMIYAR